MKTAYLAAAAAAVCCASAAVADGYLWLAGEFDAPYRVFRLNMQTGLIDMEVQLGAYDATADVFNNLAYDGKTLYIGQDDNGLFMKADPLTANIQDVGKYNGVGDNMGWEDGAFNTKAGTLWRGGSGRVLETDTDGNVLNLFTGGGNYVGLEWYNGTLYATDFNSVGKVVFDGNAVSYQPIPITGVAPDQAFYGLAEDQSTGTLYLVTHGSLFANFQGYIYALDLDAGKAVQAFDLNAAGYPPTGNGGWINPDAMGWVPVPAPGASAMAALVALAASRRRRD